MNSDPLEEDDCPNTAFKEENFTFFVLGEEVGGVWMMIIISTFIHIAILSTYYTRERLALCSSVYFLADDIMVFDASPADGSSTRDITDLCITYIHHDFVPVDFAGHF